MGSQYDYQNPETGQIITLYQGMNDSHVYKDENGIEWTRLFTSPGTIIDSVFHMDPKSPQEFVEKTGKMRGGKMDELFKLSSELSERRIQKEGRDVVQEKSWSKYESSRARGTVHPARKKQQLKEACPSRRLLQIT